MNVKEEKNALRKQCAAIRDGITGQEKQRRDDRICLLVSSLAVFRFAQAVLLYHPIRSEVDVRPLIQTALAAGQEVYLPRCDKVISGKMTFHRVLHEKELVSGVFGVMEPSEEAPLYDPTDGKRAVCVIPALAYGKDGYRLGYGKGYYDRFLADFTGSTVGVAYNELLLATVPHNRFDLRADLVVTEKGGRLTREV